MDKLSKSEILKQISHFTLQPIQNQILARALALVNLFQEETIAFLLSIEFPEVSGTLTVTNFGSNFGVLVVLDKIEGYSTHREVYGNYDR